ncbi:uncharacterized protein YyaL (SSP411 family) [Scopulibacillus daqui]|uniref:Uncharacterized protein YyaL (SSP411 family) n=1 Tax=Scopulibacillus daqui TaxID=1469162 RepID=A0ABS2Q4B3_9BACL|nr:uncharacterized protein YyaL (SSP411 family) [Scopulibacillus daqui]
MAHESFEDEEVAAILNESYISIKVDREERPDIDAIYMTVCQALTGQGGWPLNVFLTPDQKPFYAGTYFPKESMYGRPGFKDVLLSLKQQYYDNPEKMTEISSQIVRTLSEQPRSETPISEGILDKCFEHFSQTFDPRFGGFGQAPKFPSPHQLMYLLRYHRWKEDDEAMEMVIRTLDSMADGGIYDHIGGGFSRYSVDEKWLVPHFEKMLYDQALLMMAYTEAYQVAGSNRYQRIVEEIYEYVTRELKDSQGGFYCAEDADSEGVEGKYYLWDKQEIIDILGDDSGELFCDAYGITDEGNFEGRNIPNLINTSLIPLAERYQMEAGQLKTQLNNAKSKLLEHRSKRVHPHKDDKILTSWNGLMIAALAKAARVFNNESYLLTAEKAFSFIEEHMIKDGHLMARYRDGDVKFKGYLDDYAFFIWACDALYEATYDFGYLEKMKQWTDHMLSNFWDEKNDGFYLYSKDADELILRPKEVYDGAIPSGNSVAALMLMKLSRRLGETGYETYANRLLAAFSNRINAYPMGYAQFLTAHLFIQSQPKELVIFKGKDEEAYHQALRKLNSMLLPEVVITAGEAEQLKEDIAFLKDYKTIDGRTTYFLCRQFQCEQPATDFQSIYEKLK